MGSISIFVISTKLPWFSRTSRTFGSSGSNNTLARLGTSIARLSWPHVAGDRRYVDRSREASDESRGLADVGGEQIHNLAGPTYDLLVACPVSADRDTSRIINRRRRIRTI